MATESSPTSALARSVLTLDEDFAELERLSAQLERLPLDSESAFEKAKHFLARFGDCSLRIGSGIQAMAAALDEARGRAERAAEIVAARAATVQRRQDQHEQLLEGFRRIGEQVRVVTSEVARSVRPAAELSSPEERAAFGERLQSLDTQLGHLIEAAHSLRSAARDAKLKTLEANADTLEQSMKAARRKLSSALPPAEAVVRRDPQNLN